MDFYLLILYPETLHNSPFSFRRVVLFCLFFIHSLGFSAQTIISSSNRNSFLSSFPIWMALISCSCLIEAARTSNTTLNKNAESRYLGLVPNLREKTSRLLALDMMLTGGFLQMPFIKLKKFPSIPSWLRVLSWMSTGFCAIIFPYQLIWSHDFLSPADMVAYNAWFSNTDLRWVF